MPIVLKGALAGLRVLDLICVERYATRLLKRGDSVIDKEKAAFHREKPGTGLLNGGEG